MSQPGQVSHGIPAREPVAELARRIEDLQREVRQMHGMIVQATNTANRAVGNMTAKNWFVSNFSVPHAGADVINQTITVPVGYTKCGIMLVGSAVAVNSSGAADNLIINLKADVFVSGGNYASSTGGTGTAASLGTEWTFANSLGGDPSDPTRNFPVKLTLATGTSSWATSAGNWAQLAILIVWQP